MFLVETMTEKALSGAELCAECPCSGAGGGSCSLPQGCSSSVGSLQGRGQGLPPSPQVREGFERHKWSFVGIPLGNGTRVDWLCLLLGEIDTHTHTHLPHMHSCLLDYNSYITCHLLFCISPQITESSLLSFLTLFWTPVS